MHIKSNIEVLKDKPEIIMLHKTYYPDNLKLNYLQIDKTIVAKPKIMVSGCID